MAALRYDYQGDALRYSSGRAKRGSIDDIAEDEVTVGKGWC